MKTLGVIKVCRHNFVVMGIEPEKGRTLLMCNSIKTRHILSLFTLLTLFVFYILVAVSSQLSFVDNVTMKMKSDIVFVFNNLVNYSRSVPLNDSRLVSSKDPTRSSRLHQASSRATVLVNHSSLPSSAKTHIAILTQEKQYNIQNNTHLINIDETNKSNPNDQRKDVCAQCFRHDFNYIIDNEKICKMTQKGQVIKVLILIMTEHKHILQRNAIRKTWLTYAKRNTGEVRYAFLLGEVNNSALRTTILKENKVFHDIVKEDFTDTYTNLTLKTIMAFKWATTKCAHAQFVMKTDDDMYVNVPNLLNSVSKYENALQYGLGGVCHMQAQPNRDRRSKWFASVKSYPGRRYPGFCSGTGYVTSMEVVRKVYELSPSIPFFHLEDVYVALCIKKLGFKLTPLPGFRVSKPRLDPCIYKHSGFITAHELSANELRFIWRAECRRFKWSN